MSMEGVGVTGWPVGLLNHTPFKANSTRASSAPLVSLPPLFLFSLSPNAHRDQLSKRQCPFNNFLRYTEMISLLLNTFLAVLHVVVTQSLQVPMRHAWKHQLKILACLDIFTCSLIICQDLIQIKLKLHISPLNSVSFHQDKLGQNYAYASTFSIKLSVRKTNGYIKKRKARHF